MEGREGKAITVFVIKVRHCELSDISTISRKRDDKNIGI
ncbi:hypothetical protein L861_14380 [Litchfieldella anticariensis FP35 = DSM 16096]|uniref:Uncharacterized protein n=1 Tax=Litchfieldella anticariensis (strain DSM 16096 / CECT 5854 / CIP 108499 / LMG 22089 / FP35) TaxID=1121939 RepID=S2KEZ6_LITA3|nr:hypothetical protein L861_14380 [Halomonas anticariensis FP35 = DSM 16096]